MSDLYDFIEEVNEQAICHYCRAVCYKDNAIVRKIGRRTSTIYICDKCMSNLQNHSVTDRLT